MAEPKTDPQVQPIAPGAHPPKPALTLRVGISGHRPKPDKLPRVSFPLVHQRLRAVFDAIDAALAAARLKNADFYAHNPAGPTHSVRLVSGLAEGADQFAIAARPPAWKVDAVLPFPESSYRRDFETSAIDGKTNVTADFAAALAQASTVVQLPEDPRIARGELTPDSDPKRYWILRAQGYANLGKFLLGQTDLLVVVWDGRPEEGPGGTATVVRDAIDAGIQVVWIAPQPDVAPCLIAAIDDEQRPTRAHGDFDTQLREAIATLVSVPPDSAINGAADASHNRTIAQRLATFLAETWPTDTRAVTYDLFRRLCHLQWGRIRLRIPPETVQDSYVAPWEKFLASTPRAGTLDRNIRTILLPRYMWADALAVERSHWYRAAYFNCYLLAAITVGIALFGLFTISNHAGALLAYKAALVLIELALIGTIITIVRHGWHSHWQERWVEYRALAEMLRGTRSLAYLGVYGGIQRPGRLEPASSAWFLWYLRATIRELGLPNAKLDEDYLRAQLTSVRAHVIEDQLRYHGPNVDNAAHIHRVLKWIRDACFVATFVILALFLAGYVTFILGMVITGRAELGLIGLGAGDPIAHDLHHVHGGLDLLGWLLYRAKTFVTFFAAFLPALGAAIAGIQETGDFEGLALRSAKTANALTEIDGQIARVLHQPTLDTTAAILLSTAEVLTEDLGAWQSIYGRKHLGLP